MKVKKIFQLFILTLGLLGISCSEDDGVSSENSDEGLYDLYVYDTESDTDTRITDSPENNEIDIRLSPIENKIVFQGAEAIQIVDIDGKNQKSIVDDYGYGGYDIAPSGKQIAYSDGSHIFLANIDGSNKRQLTDTNIKLYRPKFALVGTKILASGENGLYLVDLEGTVEQIYERESGNTIVDATAWSHDGSKITFDLYSGSSSKVFVYDIKDKTLLEISAGYQPVWHPTKLEVLFTRISSSSSTELVSIKSDGTQETIIDDKGYHAYQKWSPDGQNIVFVNGKGNVSVMNSDGSSTKEINRLKGNSWEPNWTFDGRYIVYYRAVWYL